MLIGTITKHPVYSLLVAAALVVTVAQVASGGRITGQGLGIGSSSSFVAIVYINGVRLKPEQIGLLDAAGIELHTGRYWYDGRCGALGPEGAGVTGFAPASLDLGGGILRPDSSGGHTGIFINGRQLHVSDVISLGAKGVSLKPGRYWLDDDGRGGAEGDMSSFVLTQIAKANAHRRRNS